MAMLSGANGTNVNKSIDGGAGAEWPALHHLPECAQQP